ncbi:AgmX/PglI C-terminal domain-containing protein [Hyalangium gracile]|uniref:AgmX/PglI C-terminal domain-containing protein n=1 Tax=Hyalangium gracile TaxID=394092 RepID=UPI001CCA55EA|nr:AgmX/PglI C-terminal domain-containing protein [Hyalangium gracile]
MAHPLAMALLALSLSSTPVIPRATGRAPKPPAPVENPKPPPPAPETPQPQRPPRDEPSEQHAQNTQREDPAFAVIRQNTSQIESCFARARARSPRIQGEVVVEWDMTLGGYVEKAQATSNTTGDSELASCIVSAVKGWSFPGRDITHPSHLRHAFRLTVLQ